jgi:hypothetical protein
LIVLGIHVEIDVRVLPVDLRHGARDGHREAAVVLGGKRMCAAIETVPTRRAQATTSAALMLTLVSGETAPAL